MSKIDFKKESKNTLTVASKDFTEQNILCEMSSIYIENNTNIKVNKQCNLGGAQVVFQALQRDDIDFYIDYLGTDYTDILKYDPISNVDKVYQTVKEEFASKYNIAVLSPMSFNNTYALAVTKELASKYNLRTISDLAKISKDLTISPTLEFVNRKDGLPGLLTNYNLEFKNIIAMDGSPRYTALLNNNSQVIDAFTTDGLLRKFNLTVLEDDKNFFPPYYAVPILKQKTLEKYPELEALMSKLGSYLTDEVMQELNYEVDELGKSPEEVANNFLVTNNLISTTSVK
jgi:glycine betaine/carnitine/choline transport system permease protein opucb